MLDWTLVTLLFIILAAGLVLHRFLRGPSLRAYDPPVEQRPGGRDTASTEHQECGTDDADLRCDPDEISSSFSYSSHNGCASHAGGHEHHESDTHENQSETKDHSGSTGDHCACAKY